MKIYFQNERKLTLLFRGQKFINAIYKILLKNRWMKNNGYSIQEEPPSSSLSPKLVHLLCQKKADTKRLDDQADPNYTDEDLYLKMPCVQEVKVIFLNQGAILQDIIKEQYNHFTNFVHIYYFPI